MTSKLAAPTLTATLHNIDQALAENIDRSIEIRQRISALANGIAQGQPVQELFKQETPPRSVELLTANHTTLEGLGSAFRVALANALRDEGMTIAAIAELFGVTRQRVSALLKQLGPLQ